MMGRFAAIWHRALVRIDIAIRDRMLLFPVTLIGGIATANMAAAIGVPESQIASVSASSAIVLCGAFAIAVTRAMRMDATASPGYIGAIRSMAPMEQESRFLNDVRWRLHHGRPLRRTDLLDALDRTRVVLRDRKNRRTRDAQMEALGSKVGTPNG